MEPHQAQAHIALHLSRASYDQVVHTLRAALPPPSTDAPEAEACRDRAAIAHVAALLPADSQEAHIAVQYVAAAARALDCLRLARACSDSPALFLKRTAQLSHMMRQTRSWHVLLLRIQAARQKRDADTAARDEDPQTKHHALGLMAEALAHPPPPPATAEQPDPAAQLDPIAEAEQYALHHRKRAALIRALPRLPHRMNIGPTRPEVVHLLQALDPRPRNAQRVPA